MQVAQSQQTSGKTSTDWSQHRSQLWIWAVYFQLVGFPERWIYFIILIDLIMALTGSGEEGPERQKK